MSPIFATACSAPLKLPDRMDVPTLPAAVLSSATSWSVRVMSGAVDEISSASTGDKLSAATGTNAAAPAVKSPLTMRSMATTAVEGMSPIFATA